METTREQIDKELREQIELDEEFKKKTKEEQYKLLMTASLLTGHDLLGNLGISEVM